MVMLSQETQVTLERLLQESQVTLESDTRQRVTYVGAPPRSVDVHFYQTKPNSNSKVGSWFQILLPILAPAQDRISLLLLVQSSIFKIIFKNLQNPLKNVQHKFLHNFCWKLRQTQIPTQTSGNPCSNQESEFASLFLWTFLQRRAIYIFTRLLLLAGSLDKPQLWGLILNSWPWF